MTPAVLFTIDVEEFVLPREYGLTFDPEEAYRLGANGLERLDSLMARHAAPATLFVTVEFARRFEALLRQMCARGCEIALHAVDHAHDYSAMPADTAERLLGEGRADLCRRFSVPVQGYRANQFRSPPRDVLKRIGFSWTSNLHPAWVPGAYNHSKAPRQIHEWEGLVEVPISATPKWRLPISWFWMRNLGFQYLKRAAKRVHGDTGFVHLYVHPWEAAELPALPGLPLKGRLSMRRCGAPFLELVNRFLSLARTEGWIPRTISEHLQWIRLNAGGNS